MSNGVIARRIERALHGKNTELFLSGLQLRDLPPEIVQLTSLTSLGLSDNQLSELPPEIGRLTSLTSLELSDNQLSELPPEIGQLMSLTTLGLSGNKLSELPPEIVQLTSLTTLYLYMNQLRDLPPEIGQLTSLTSLNLSGNQLRELLPEIGRLTSLTTLGLSDSQLSELPPEIGQLTSLTTLELSGNQLSELPLEIGRFVNLKKLIVEGNPLTSPPLEIVNRGVNAVRNYLFSLQGESQVLNEAKILLVGDGMSGKTSLTRCLLGESFNSEEPTTHGIRIKNWQVDTGNKEVRFNIWDFGGQEIMHATHQFFLSKRSLYVLVLDGRRDERPEYWLRHIESFGGDSPVLVVMNKYDANPGYDINRPFLREKYPTIRGFFRTSCATGHGIDEFKAALIQELTQVKMIETRWANNWFRVKQQLERLEEHYISYDQYENICIEVGITEEISQDVLVEFLNDLGIIVHFKEFELEDTHVLDPKWVTTAVYKIVNSPIVAANRGLLQLSDLSDILKEQGAEDYFYPRSKFKYIIGLMRKFELCYNLNAESVLIPQLLDVVEPEFDFDYEGSLKFVISYDDFLPLSVMPRFMVKRHQDIKGELRWRTGAVLENKAFQTTAVIRADNEAHRIDIYVNGNQPKDYLIVILLFFREINDSFEKLKVSELVPMPDEPNITASYKTLVNYAQKGLKDYIPDGSDEIYRVSDLLGLVQLDEKGDDQEILEILRRIEDTVVDKESFVKTASKIIDLKPNVMGIGVNLNELFEKLYDSFKKSTSI